MATLSAVCLMATEYLLQDTCAFERVNGSGEHMQVCI